VSRSLFVAVQDESGSAGALFDDGTETCSPRAGTANTWRCDVIDRQGSGGARYRVLVRDGSCWEATLVRDDS
jgi:hypothetical protein